MGLLLTSLCTWSWSQVYLGNIWSQVYLGALSDELDYSQPFPVTMYGELEPSLFQDSFCSEERLTRGTVTTAMRRAAHSFEYARCGAGAGCSAS